MHFASERSPRAAASKPAGRSGAEATRQPIQERAEDMIMAKDKGQVRRVLQILSPEDQETLALLHDPPRMEELLRRYETLAEVEAAGITGARGNALEGIDLGRPPLPGLRLFPAVHDELTGLSAAVRDVLLQVHLPALLEAPQAGLALTQLFQGLWVTLCSVDGTDYRIVYQIDTQEAGITLLMVGSWESLEQRLEEA
jgi:hypothetical protein